MLSFLPSHTFTLFLLLSSLLGGLCLPMNQEDPHSKGRYSTFALSLVTIKDPKALRSGAVTVAMYFGSRHYIAAHYDPELRPPQFQGRVGNRMRSNYRTYKLTDANFPGHPSRNDFIEVLNRLARLSAPSVEKWANNIFEQLVQDNIIQEIPPKWIEALGQKGFDAKGNKVEAGH
ncbi:hypothetical protein F5050DRAFT_1736606 [Lentinula boryana]|uniref:Uncharacterized protein n=1 Tax=Lentinula boryana TaxID=40481 RepID=A0ABQ8QMR7_9AGAR|nr:hypothetical protein F5050DRAFT_1736606 [Lentinula boryana]